MRRDNKPYSVRLLINAVRDFYTRWRIVPQFDSVGSGLEIVGGTSVGNLRLQHSFGQQCAYSNCARANVTTMHMAGWKGGNGTIRIGDNVLLTPGLKSCLRVLSRLATM